MNRKYKNIITIVLISALPFVFSFCAGMRAQRLKETIEKYNLAYKWGGPAATSPLIAKDVREKILESRISVMQGKNIVEYTLANLSFESNSKAKAIVQYSYIDQANQSVHGFAELQTWELKKGAWRVTSVVASNRPTGIKLN